MSQSKFPMRRRSLLPMALGALSVLACSQQVAPSQQQQNQQKLTPTSDGDKTIVLANQILNTYAAVTADVAAGAKTVDVDSAQLAVMGLKTGDLIMIMQMQGAQITTTDDETYGTIMNPANPNGAGRFELVQVASVDVAGGVVTVDGLCGGLKNAYRADSHSQIIRVPQFDNLTVTSAGSINPLKWDRDLGIGGVVALRAKHFRIQGSIDASGQGFAGGQEQLPLAKLGGTAAVDTFVSEDDPTVGGTKGGADIGVEVARPVALRCCNGAPPCRRASCRARPGRRRSPRRPTSRWPRGRCRRRSPPPPEAGSSRAAWRG